MLFIIFKIIGYLGWAATTALGAGGSWFWNFTKPDIKDPNKKHLTKPGRRAIYLMFISVMCAVVLTIYTEIDSYYKGIAEAKEKKNLEKQLQAVRSENSELNLTVSQLLRRHGILEYASGDRLFRNLLDQFKPHIHGRYQERLRLSKLTGVPIHFGAMGIFGTFNLRDPIGREQQGDQIEKLATIITLVEGDVIFIQEVRNQEQLKTLRLLLPQYEIRWTNVGRMQGAPGTGLAILYRRATVNILGEPEVLRSWSIMDKEHRWYRVPFAQTIQIGTLKCQLLNLHLYWGARSGERLERRERELKELARWIKRRKSTLPLIIAGVFHWPNDEPNMQEFSKLGVFFPTTELPPNATELTYSDKVQRYSHFALSEVLKGRYITGSVRYQPLKPLFPDWKRENWLQFADKNPLLIALRID